MPFLEINYYYDFLKVCQKNIVRGENSFIKAILAWKPYLWDIYKEPNMQHIYKIDEFWDYILNPEFKNILTNFNIKNIILWFREFLEFNNDEFFQSKSKILYEKCDLIKNLEILIQKK